MIVYHGTGLYNLKSLLSSRPRIQPRYYLNGRKAFSTTQDRKIAELFALRRSPPSILIGDESGAGVILEYSFFEFTGRGRRWIETADLGILQDEQEIAILKPEILKLQAVWRLKGGIWIRRKARAA